MCLSIAVHSPERVLSQGTHEGFDWVVVHNGCGYRCGYIRVMSGHPWHGKDWEEVDANVHGGLTFAQADEPCDNQGEDDGWWLGFNCAHAGDVPDPDLPGERYTTGPIGVVRSQEYVENECRSLCEQAMEANNGRNRNN